MTLAWHVDNVKLSHLEPGEVTAMIDWMEATYGKMRVSRGKRHDYLGMVLDYSTPGEVQVSMSKYLEGVLSDFPEEISGSATTPAADHLFQVRPEAEREPLGEKKARAFHHAVAQLLFACICTRKDIQPAVEFLTTRVREPDQDDWGKLVRVLRYLRGTINMPLTLRADGLNVVKWWVDASFATHGDYRSHMGATMSL